MGNTLPPLSQVVSRYGLGANKTLGQHFLLDMSVTDQIARLAGDISEHNIAEVGPGPGGLTRALLARNPKQLLSIEMDERFLPALADIGAIYPGRFSVIHGDAVKINIAQYLPSPITIAANLPYNVGTKLLIDWLCAAPLFWEQAILMFQKEVAERICAAPGEKAYGRLAILSQSVCECHIAFDVPAAAFSPPPKVDSAVVVLRPYPEEKRFSDLTALSQVTQAAFNMRRKMLRRSLKTFAASRRLDLDIWLQGAGLDPTSRPETVSVEAFQKLASSMK